MIPENSLSSVPVPSKFIPPDELYRGPYQDAERGGIALSDPSQGHDVQTWYGQYDTLTKRATVTNSIPPVVTTELFTRTDNVISFSFCFDQNMLWYAVVCTTDGSAYLYWYDPTVSNRVITEYPNVRNARLALDDKRPISLATGRSDVLFTYLSADNKLYIRNQRERFLTAYLLAEDLRSNYIISRFGLNRVNRMQWELALNRFISGD